MKMDNGSIHILTLDPIIKNENENRYWDSRNSKYHYIFHFDRDDVRKAYEETKLIKNNKEFMITLFNIIKNNYNNKYDFTSMIDFFINYFEQLEYDDEIRIELDF